MTFTLGFSLACGMPGSRAPMLKAGGILEVVSGEGAARSARAGAWTGRKQDGG